MVLSVPLSAEVSVDMQELTITVSERIMCRDSITDMVIAAKEQGFSGIHIDLAETPLGPDIFYVWVEKLDGQSRMYKRIALNVHDIIPEF